jgi:hypothetical protein
VDSRGHLALETVGLTRHRPTGAAARHLQGGGSGSATPSRTSVRLPPSSSLLTGVGAPFEGHQYPETRGLDICGSWAREE